MGLDVSFNRKQALIAGLEVKRIVNGTPDEIRFAKASEDEDYLSWLTEEREVIVVPGMDYTVENNGVDNIIVRANKWGSTYEPLTNWLKANSIEWEEF